VRPGAYPGALPGYNLTCKHFPPGRGSNPGACTIKLFTAVIYGFS
jgi:hypothetical protein